MQVQWEHRLIALAASPGAESYHPTAASSASGPALRAAYRLAEAVTRQHSKSFHLASGLLPASKREAIRALYAFCRTVDDIVDACRHCDNLADLESWRQIVRTASAPPLDPVALAWVDAMRRFQIPRRYALQLIDGVARDLSVDRYLTFDELSTYCYSVASTVGLMSMHIVGFASDEAVPYAIKLGVALQLTNILRDVGEDLRNGRIYLPLEELHAFGLDESDLPGSVSSPRWREFMQFQIERARRLYAESRPGIRLLQRDGQLAIAAASDLYAAILEQIEKNGYDVFSRRAALGPWAKLGRIPRILLGLEAGRRHPGAVAGFPSASTL